ncbi:MAG: glycogen debranching N-terminal domain-containing protein [Bryobacteraceae bacterium]
MLAAHPDGFLHDGVEHGFFHETRLLSRYRYLIDGRPLKAVALSNIQQHSWLGYYITFPPGAAAGEPDRGSGSMQPDSEYTVELRLSRYIGGGFHEDVDLRNFTRETSRFDLTLQVDADFADLIETKGERQQFGELRREWRQQEEGVWELSFDYRAEHAYSHHGESGHSTLHRGAILRIEHSDTPPSRTAADEITFRVELGPGASWHACINLVPVLDGVRTWPKYGCRSFFGIHNEFDRKRTVFLGDSTQLTGPESHTLAPVVVAAFERAKHDLASLLLYHFDHGDRSWVPAAGLPIYLALFGRDSLTAGWQAGLATVDMMRGAARELVRWQGVEVDDWRDEQPGKMLHEAHTGPLAVLNFNPRARYYGSITTSGFFPVVVSELWRWTGDRDEIAPLIEPAL